MAFQGLRTLADDDGWPVLRSCGLGIMQHCATLFVVFVD